MTRTHLASSVFLACAMSLSTAALAQEPSFPCTKARGTVEEAICSVPTLAALDRKLDEVYKAATAKAKGAPATQLREEQRGWVKGRNDCWKANGQETWITASWTVATVNDCVEAQMRLRTSELQALWQLTPPKTTSYVCQGQPANEVVVSTFDTDPATIRLERGDRAITLWRVGTASEGRYEGRNVTLVHQDNAVNVTWLDTNSGLTEALVCAPR